MTAATLASVLKAGMMYRKMKATRSEKTAIDDTNVDSDAGKLVLHFKADDKSFQSLLDSPMFAAVKRYTARVEKSTRELPCNSLTLFLRLDRFADRLSQLLQQFFIAPVPHPQAQLFRVYQSGFGQDAHVMRDGRL